MNPIDYLKSLILGAEHTSIPVQLSELKMLLRFMQASEAQQTNVKG